MERNQRSQRGMTLIEVILSLAIFGIIIAPTAAFFANSFKTNNFAQEQLNANQLAQKYMEEYKSMSYSDLIPLIDPTTHTSTIVKSDVIDNFTTNIILTGTPTAAMPFNANVKIPASYAGKTLQLSAEGTGITVIDDLGTPVGSAYLFTPADPITVMLTQDVGTSGNITMQLVNKTAYTLQLTKITTDKFVLIPPLGNIVISNIDGEESPEARYQEAGITVTVKVTRLSDGFELAKLSQIKMTN